MMTSILNTVNIVRMAIIVQKKKLFPNAWPVFSAVRERASKPVYMLLAGAVAYNILLPLPSFSDSEFSAFTAGEQPQEEQLIVSPTNAVELPAIEQAEPRVLRRYHSQVTYYLSLPEQTDGDPFTTASGTHVHEGTVAANCLPFGTKLRMPDLFGDRILTVEDRLNARHGCFIIDVWMPERQAHFGAPITNVEIVENMPTYHPLLRTE
ncbi:MAG: 3D domain-containing protein [Candidatus Kerfeldbacteria bacterium]|nr:3D domain-containing protein [Candidatus Kerfeldbacteria bacterium]